MTELHSTNATDEREDYWDAYYAERATLTRPLPSQFAAFVAGELGTPHRVVEFGCGGGRDSIFFASYGHDVIGVDASEEAVKSCRRLAEGLGVDATFVASDIDDAALVERLGDHDGQQALYARFFVHAITDGEEQAFLDLCANVTRPGDLLAVEYRTVRDQVGSKVTERHYRRFVHPSRFQAHALERGFDVTYAVEGYGFAKYREDDAYVARALLVRV